MSTSHLIISITRNVLPENSSDLDRGRRPEPKSDEFSGSTFLVIEIICLLGVKQPEKVLRLLGASLHVPKIMDRIYEVLSRTSYAHVLGYADRRLIVYSYNSRSRDAEA